MRVAQIVAGRRPSEAIVDAARCIECLLPAGVDATIRRIDEVRDLRSDAVVLHVVSEGVDNQTSTAIATLAPAILVRHESASPSLVERLEGTSSAHVIDANDLAPRVAIRPDVAMSRDIATSMPGPIVSCMDRIDADYPTQLLLGAHHLVCVHGDPATRLIAAGLEASERDGLVEDFIVSTHLDTVWRTSTFTPAQRSAAIDASGVLVALSAAPSTWLAVRDAMGLGTAVVVRDVGALSVTVGDAGLVMPAECGARELAEAVMRVLADRRLRGAMAERGRRRAAQTRSFDVVAPVLHALRDVITCGVVRR
jgi:hypothetical protein